MKKFPLTQRGADHFIVFDQQDSHSGISRGRLRPTELKKHLLGRH